MICDNMFAKIQMCLSPGQQDNSNALLPGKAINQISALCPAFPPPPHPPPRQLDIDRFITQLTFYFALQNKGADKTNMILTCLT